MSVCFIQSVCTYVWNIVYVNILKLIGKQKNSLSPLSISNLSFYKNHFISWILNKNQQEAFRERRHLHVSDLWPWVVTLTLCRGKIGLAMSLDVAYCIYLGTRYDVCECNSLRHMTISSFFLPLTFACDLHRPAWSLSFLFLDGH